MEWLQTLLESSTTPIVTALVLGLITALSPCPLATNIAAIGYIGKCIGNRRQMFCSGLLYALGRVVAYTLLGVVLIVLAKGGSGLFGVQKFISKYAEMLLGPILLLVGVYMLFGGKLRLPSFGVNAERRGLAQHGSWGAFLLGVLFAMAFCPSSAIFYFGMLIPMSATATMGYLLPALFAVATALPVLVVAWVLAFSAGQIGRVYGQMQRVQRWLNIAVGILFLLIGIYYCLIHYL